MRLSLIEMENQTVAGHSNVNINLQSQKILPQSHSTPKQIDRKTLQTLQNAASGKGQLNGGKLTKQQELKTSVCYENSSPFVVSPRGVKIFHDQDTSGTSRVHCTRETQTDTSLLDDLVQQKIMQMVEGSEDSGVQCNSESQEALDLMVNENPSEGYWKDVAEERRRALKETLVENERLVAEVDHLKEENARLADIEQKAEALQKLLEDILPDEGLEESDPGGTEDGSDLHSTPSESDPDQEPPGQTDVEDNQS